MMGSVSRPSRPLATALAFVPVALLGCREPDEGKSEGKAIECPVDTEQGSFRATLDVPEFDFPLEIETAYAHGTPLMEDGQPVVVGVLGDFSWRSLPLKASNVRLRKNRGILQIYMNLPKSGEGLDDGAHGDWRGAASRGALAAVLRYAAGLERDRIGCLLSERAGVPISSAPPLLYGHSNGANLAVATLADPSLEVPALTGLVAFEAPPSAQFVTVEVGSLASPNPVYEVGSCGTDATWGFLCPLDYSSIAWSDDVVRKNGENGGLFFDLDGDGFFEPTEEYPVWGLRVPVDGVEYAVFSSPLSAYLDEHGIETLERFSADEADAFWLPREAARQAPGALARQPDLKAIVIGTETDHMIGAPDHPHVSGLAALLSAAGAPWVRVNPDASYVEMLVSLDETFSDNPANLDLSSGSADLTLEPDEDDETLFTADYATAAAIELFQRSAVGDWSVDLEAPLWTP